jgi:hypothetical protein
MNRRGERQDRGRGTECRPRSTVHTDSVTLRSQFTVKQPWLWMLIDAGLIVSAIAGMLMMK